ncbi:hypothetical protein DFP72DRAFT_863226 [Ephemerocybe angulata]|uniref:Uncharacterized protein n=1 Tax=Ephemerocybe angulata TaxID=980116 RepID=A0A8H6LU93_9AGAR|nr:hypothetical protein DFP72DRAFT_863226 [Tulosesus angulatus]
MNTDEIAPAAVQEAQPSSSSRHTIHDQSRYLVENTETAAHLQRKKKETKEGKQRGTQKRPQPNHQCGSGGRALPKQFGGVQIGGVVQTSRRVSRYEEERWRVPTGSATSVDQPTGGAVISRRCSLATDLSPAEREHIVALDSFAPKPILVIKPRALMGDGLRGSADLHPQAVFTRPCGVFDNQVKNATSARGEVLLVSVRGAAVGGNSFLEEGSERRLERNIDGLARFETEATLRQDIIDLLTSIELIVVLLKRD